MKYCSHCGKEVLDEAVFCPHCGCSVQGTPDDTLNKQQQQQQPNYAPQPQQESYIPLTVVGFVFAFVSSLVGLILSIVAFKNAKEVGNTKSMALSRAGIIISAVLLGVEFIIGLIVGTIYGSLIFDLIMMY